MCSERGGGYGGCSRRPTTQTGRGGAGGSPFKSAHPTPSLGKYRNRNRLAATGYPPELSVHWSMQGWHPSRSWGQATFRRQGDPHPRGSEKRWTPSEPGARLAQRQSARPRHPLSDLQAALPLEQVLLPFWLFYMHKRPASGLSPALSNRASGPRQAPCIYLLHEITSSYSRTLPRVYNAASSAPSLGLYVNGTGPLSASTPSFSFRLSLFATATPPLVCEYDTERAKHPRTRLARS